EREILSFAAKFIHPALRAYGRVGGHEELDLRFRKYVGTDVAAVQYHAFSPSHLSLQAYHGRAHLADGADLAHRVTHAHGAYVALHVHTVQIHIGMVGGRIHLEADLELRQHA